MVSIAALAPMPTSAFVTRSYSGVFTSDRAPLVLVASSSRSFGPPRSTASE